MAKKLILVSDENGCITPTSHKLNKDGYFRKNIGNNTWVMYHRYMWELHNGQIPEGYEINHKCGNRACCNTDHLELLEGSEHAILTNQERYADRRKTAYRDWLSGMNGTQLAKKFGVTISCACRWVREWKA